MSKHISYNKETGMFSLSDKQEVTTQINSWLDKEREDSYKFTSRDIVVI